MGTIPRLAFSQASPDPRPEGQPGSTSEQDRLITEHIPLVGHIVRETLGRLPGHVGRDDLMSAGLTALVQAARGFDASRGVPFGRYAATRIRGAIVDELRGIDWASRSVRRMAREVEQARVTMTATLGRTPTADEIAAALGVSPEEVAANDDDVNRASLMSLQGFGETPIDSLIPSAVPSPEAALEHREQLGYLVDAISELPERLRTVVQDYFFAERPMADIAADLHITESRVSQMRAEALTLLRDAMNSALAPELVTPHPRPDGAAARRRNAYFDAVAARRSVSARLGALAAVDAIA